MLINASIIGKQIFIPKQMEFQTRKTRVECHSVSSNTLFELELDFVTKLHEKLYLSCNMS